MKKAIIFLFLGVLFSSCTGETLNGVYGEAEKAYEADPTPQNLNKLTSAYTEYLTAFPDSDDFTSISMKNADLQAQANRFQAAIDGYKSVLKNDFAAPEASDAALKLAKVYGEKLNNKLGQAAVEHGVTAAFPDQAKAAGVSPSGPGIDSLLQDLGARIYNDKTNRIDFKVANDFINIAEIHALLNPESPKAAEYLHDAGRTAGYQRAFPKAISLYDWVLEKYPDHEQTANSTFMLGYTYDNDLKDYGEARTYYEKFLEKYPKHDLAASARVLLENLGVPDDEIIEKLQGK